MTVIGDMIISGRELFPDMPQTIPAPTASAAVVTVASTLPPGTYNVIVTQRNPWGETLGAAEITGLVVGAGQGIQITSPLLPSATTIRAYLTSGAAGTELQFIESTVSPFNITTPLTASGAPPSRSTAWLPDTDGKMVSAFTVYRWLTQGLSRLARKVGGITDYTAIGSVVSQPMYVMNGQWQKINSMWYDGFDLTLANQRDYFRRNTIQSSVLASAAVSIAADRIILEVFYQPIRTAGATTLSVAMVTPSDITATMTSIGGFQTFAPPMFVQFGTGPTAEIAAFSLLSGTTLKNLIRGVGGTTPQAWPQGTQVFELNMPILGKRLFSSTYLPGNSLNVLPVPIGWETILPTFLLHKMREAEQERSEAQGLLKEFDDACMEFLRSNRQLAGPQQVKQSPVIETVPGFGSSLGGVVLP